MQVERSVAEIMEADHAELDKLLAELISGISVDEPDLVLGYRKLDLFWARLAVHIRAEHLVLFPEVIKAAGDLGVDGDEAVALLQELRRDHDFFVKELARAVKAMRLVPDFGNKAETFEVVRRLVVQVQQRLERHNRIEEDIVYPIATVRPHAEAIRERVIKELQNLPARFQGYDREWPDTTKMPRQRGTN